MAQPTLVRVLAALTVVILVIFQTCEAQSVCYRTISRQESYSTYTRQSYTTSYGCGWWRRCRRINYRQQSVTDYRRRYSSQSQCCLGYQSCSSRCCPVCDPPCQNGGQCASPGYCTCPTGWSGTQCDQAVCDPPCQNGGQCASPGYCTCPTGWSGAQCDQAQCRIHCVYGTCVGPNVCSCYPGWQGAGCDQVANSHTSSLTRAATTTLKTSLISSSNSHTPLLIPTRPNATLKTSLISSSSSHTPLLIPTRPNATLKTSKDVSTSTVLSSSPALGVNGDPTLQSSYSSMNTDLEPDTITAPGILLTGMLGGVAILIIAAVITVVVLIVVIRRRKKATMTVKNESVQTHDVQKVPKSNATTNPNNGTTNTDGPNTDERVLHNPMYGALLNLQDGSTSAEPTDERVLHNPMYGTPLKVQDGSTSAEPTDERVLQNPVYGSPLNLQDGSNGVPLYSSVNVKDSSLMHIYEGIVNTTPGVSGGSYNNRHSPEQYEVPVPHTDKSTMPAAAVPDTGEYSQVVEPSNAKPGENGKDHDDHSHLRH